MIKYKLIFVLEDGEVQLSENLQKLYFVQGGTLQTLDNFLDDHPFYCTSLFLKSISVLVPCLCDNSRACLDKCLASLIVVLQVIWRIKIQRTIQWPLSNIQLHIPSSVSQESPPTNIFLKQKQITFAVTLFKSYQQNINISKFLNVFKNRIIKC